MLLPGNPIRRMLSIMTCSSKDSLDPETHYEKAILLEQMKDTAQAISVTPQGLFNRGVEIYGLELAHLYAEQKNPFGPWKSAISS